MRTPEDSTSTITTRVVGTTFCCTTSTSTITTTTFLSSNSVGVGCCYQQHMTAATGVVVELLHTSPLVVLYYYYSRSSLVRGKGTSIAFVCHQNNWIGIQQAARQAGRQAGVVIVLPLLRNLGVMILLASSTVTYNIKLFVSVISHRVIHGCW